MRSSFHKTKQATFRIILLGVMLLAFNACKNPQSSNSKALADTSTISHEKLKSSASLQEFKLGFLNNSLSKVYQVIGQPDDKGLSESLRKGHLVYYNKVIENGTSKHLVIFYGYDSQNSNEMVVKDVSAMEDGGYYHQSSYGGFTITKPQHDSNQNGNAEDRAYQIRLEYGKLILSSLNQYSGKFFGKSATFYYDQKLKLQVIEEEFVSSASRGEIRYTTYFFQNEKLTFRHDSDNINSPSVEQYYHNDKNFYSAIHGKETECSYDCVLTFDSRPYRLLAAFKSQVEAKIIQ